MRLVLEVPEIERSPNGMWLVLPHPHRDVWIPNEIVVRPEEEQQ